MLFPFPRCRVLQVGYPGAHSTGLSLTSMWAHTGQLQMFLKPFPTFIITLYPFLLLELLAALNPSLPTYRLLFHTTFLVKLNLWFNSHQKKLFQKRQWQSWSSYAGYKEVLKFLKARGKWFLVLSWQEPLEIATHAPFTTRPEDVPQRNSASLTTGKRPEKLLWERERRSCIE